MEFIPASNINFSRQEKIQEISSTPQVYPAIQQTTTSAASVKSAYRRLHAETAFLKQAIDMQMRDAVVANELEAKKRAQEFIAKYNLPTDAEIYFDAAANKTTVIWRGDTNMDVFKQKFPQAFHKNDWLACAVQKAKLEFIADQPVQLETVYFGQTSWGHDYPNPNFL
ncbi:MAG TPA: hypothetical protein VGO47_11655, partial [Chlamydiales bacterium]|nr:hypothetical protein [Chlamydiales bacterium]